MRLLSLLLVALTFSACAEIRVKDAKGRTRFVANGTNMEHVEYKDAEGTWFVADKVDNSTSTNLIGMNFTKAVTAAGAAISTSGFMTFFK